VRFSHVVRGARAIRPVALTLPDGRVVRCGVRPLHPDTEEPVLAEDARQRTLEEGGQPRIGDPLFESWIQVLTLARACVDVDAPDDALEPFFDGGVAQIRERLDGDTIRRLYHAQIAFQVECNTLDPGADFADRLLGLEGDALSPQVLAAAFAVELFAYYGRPAYTLTSAQILLWMSLKAKYRKRFGPSA
jgi:hypothetical protein